MTHKYYHKFEANLNLEGIEITRYYIQYKYTFHGYRKITQTINDSLCQQAFDRITFDICHMLVK